MLLIDTREPQSLKDYCQRFFKGKHHLEIKELPEGDFKYKNIIFERKRIDDFISSITDGRFKSQKRKLLQKQQEGYHCYMIIQGEYQDLDEQYRLPKKVVAGAIASLNEYGIHTLSCGQYDNELFCELIDGVIRKYNEEKTSEEVFIEPDGLTWTEKSLMCIQGIGKETAKNIAKKIPHLQLFYNCSYENNKYLLMEVEGIGEKTAVKILGELYEADK